MLSRKVNSTSIISSFCVILCELIYPSIPSCSCCSPKLIFGMVVFNSSGLLFFSPIFSTFIGMSSFLRSSSCSYPVALFYSSSCITIPRDLSIKVRLLTLNSSCSILAFGSSYLCELFNGIVSSIFLGFCSVTLAEIGRSRVLFH